MSLFLFFIPFLSPTFHSSPFHTDFECMRELSWEIGQFQNFLGGGHALDIGHHDSIFPLFLDDVYQFLGDKKPLSMDYFLFGRERGEEGREEGGEEGVGEGEWGGMVPKSLVRRTRRAREHLRCSLNRSLVSFSCMVTEVNEVWLLLLGGGGGGVGGEW